MITVLVILLLVCLVSLAVCAGLLRRQQQVLAVLKKQATELEAHLHLDTLQLAQVYERGKRRHLTIEVLNPLEVAASESSLIRAVGGLSPSLVTKLVYDRVKVEVERGLAERQVEARVEIRRSE
ncbi:hypothetical protein GYB61_08720 [bacterium]|nr:hypothetical protein [bacterium]